MTEQTFSDMILENWAKDSQFDRHNAASESVNIPKLHHKYLRFLMQLNKNLAALTKRKSMLYREKGVYYSGKAEPEIYKQKPFHLKIMKSDLPDWINADDDYSTVVMKIEECKSLIEAVKSILQTIKDRNWQIRNIIEWDKFTSGAN